MLYHNRSLTTHEKYGSKKGIAASLGNIGNIHREKGDYDKALAVFEKGLEVKKKLDDQWGIATSLNNIGLLYFDKQDYNKAILFQQEGLKIRERIGDQRGVAKSYLSLDESSRKKENIDLSIQKCL